MRSMYDPVIKLKGCGPTTSDRLATSHIWTYGDLLNYRGDDSVINKFKYSARAELNMIPFKITNHSWKNERRETYDNVSSL